MLLMRPRAAGSIRNADDWLPAWLSPPATSISSTPMQNRGSVAAPSHRQPYPASISIAATSWIWRKRPPSTHRPANDAPAAPATPTRPLRPVSSEQQAKLLDRKRGREVKGVVVRVRSGGRRD